MVPLCHLYVPQDKVTCKKFDFPVVLSGHDHHVVDEVYDGTRLLKAGADAEHAVVLDIIWENESAKTPKIEAEIVKVKDWEADQTLYDTFKKAMSVLDKLERTEIAKVPERFKPLSSANGRAQDSSVAHFLFSELKKALNSRNGEVIESVDAVFISGGNIRGGKDYPVDAKFSLKDLKDELQETLEVVIVEMPGSIISAGVKATHGEPNPGYMQFDGDVVLDKDGNVESIAGEPLDENRTYKIATTLWDIVDGPSEPWTKYYKENSDKLPDTEFPITATLLSYFASFVWKQVWNSLDVNNDGVIDAEELKAIDTDNDGRISKPELAACMQKLGWEVDPDEIGFIDCIFDVAGDDNNDGYLSPDEINKSLTD